MTPSTAIGIHADMPMRCSGTDTSITSTPRLGEAVGRVPHHLVDVRFRVRMTESFGQDADPQAGRRCSQGVDVATGRHGTLARVEPVGAGHHVEQQRRCPSTDDVIGPRWSSIGSTTIAPVYGTSPYVGFIP